MLNHFKALARRIAKTDHNGHSLSMQTNPYVISDDVLFDICQYVAMNSITDLLNLARCVRQRLRYLMET